MVIISYLGDQCKLLLAICCYTLAKCKCVNYPLFLSFIGAIGHEDRNYQGVMDLSSKGIRVKVGIYHALIRYLFSIKLLIGFGLSKSLQSMI